MMSATLPMDPSLTIPLPWSKMKSGGLGPPKEKVRSSKNSRTFGVKGGRHHVSYFGCPVMPGCGGSASSTFILAFYFRKFFEKMGTAPCF